ncbi:maleylpyruvate isomerase family mycothiol-dependent enzyme [Kitasatospora sp. NPDC127059]|uniref:maleylpyruvate isomerase family mycothiol-dependent enzyme n=1 Tax=unclassified Kitasatospora TaxID=2633591 RepID=UPI003652ACFC
MEISEHIEALRHEGALLADAATRADLTAPVPTCPDWRMGDLVRHIGQVHRWAAAFPAKGLRAPLDEPGQQAVIGPAPSDAELLDWYREGHAALLTVLSAAPADLECWTFLPAPTPLAFWARRQAHETAVHRFDADAAAGAPGPAVAPELALDGIDELLRGFMRRGRAKVHTESLRTVSIRTTDGPGTWHLTLSREPLAVTTEERPEPADLTVTGPARELYLLLWNRLTVEQAERSARAGGAGQVGQTGRAGQIGKAGQVELSGDRSLLDLWRDNAAVR